MSCYHLSNTGLSHEKKKCCENKESFYKAQWLESLLKPYSSCGSHEHLFIQSVQIKSKDLNKEKIIYSTCYAYLQEIFFLLHLFPMLPYAK